MKIHRSFPASRLRSGFTLLEMVIVLGIIAMITGGAIFSMKKIGNSAKITTAESDFKSFASGLSMYKINAGNYPSTTQGLKALKEKPTSAPMPRRWSQVMVKVNLDPWGNEYIYRYPGKKDPTEPEIVSKGPDGQENTEDDLSSQDE